MSVLHSRWDREKIRELLKKEDLKIHFIGVGGVGMCSLALLSQRQGYTVSGSDRDISANVNRLISMGVKVSLGHSKENAATAELVVYTLALDEGNAELSYALRMGIPCISRAEYLGVLMEKYHSRLTVSGSHGKSTSSAMLDAVFLKAKRDPTTVIGAEIPGLGLPLRVGGDGVIIAEGCEYKDSFLHLCPTAALFTNLELDHVDYFKSIDDIKASFLKAMNIAELSVVNSDDENLASLIPYVNGRCVTYGEGKDADYRASIFEWKRGYYGFSLSDGEKEAIRARLAIPGRHNAQNASGVAALSLECGIPRETVAVALGSFSGIGRRLERLTDYGTCEVYYDYAHHPTEIKAVIETVREMTGKPVAVIFKPHTYSRTEALFSDFVSSLSLADRVLLCEISAIRELYRQSVSSSMLAKAIGEGAVCVSEANILDALSGLDKYAIIIMGAADLDTVKRLLQKK